MVIPIEILEKTNIKQHQTMENKINEIVDVVNSQGLENIKDTVNDVKARVGVLENENNTQDTEISQLGTRVTATEQKNATQDSQISEVTGRMATAEGKITALENDKADSADVTALGNRVTAVESKNATQDQAISALETDKADSADVTALTNRVTAVETKNASQDQAITVLETDKADSADVTALTNRVTAVESKNATQDQAISALETDKADSADVTALTNRVTAVETKNASQDQAITALETDKADTADVTALGDRVTAVEGKIDNIPDIKFSGPFVEQMDYRKSGSQLISHFQLHSLDNSRFTADLQVPHALDNEDGVISLSEVVLKNQGTENAGKALVVGSDGMVAPGDVGGGGGTSITTYQFNGTRDTDDFNKMRDWINAVGTYKQISANINSSNGAYTIRISMGNSGKSGGLFYGGGSFYANGPPFYPMSDCTFRLTNEDTITITAAYINEDGTRIGHNFSVKSSSYIDGSAFVI